MESEALAKSLMKTGNMKRMSAIQFKQALCMELLRCETILKDTLPSIIKVWVIQDYALSNPLAQTFAAVPGHDTKAQTYSASLVTQGDTEDGLCRHSFRRTARIKFWSCEKYVACCSDRLAAVMW